MERRNQPGGDTPADGSERRADERGLGGLAGGEGDHRLLYRALDAIDDLFYLLDADGNLVWINDRFTEVTGYSRAEILSDASRLYRPEDVAGVIADVEEALETGASELEVDLVTRDGRAIPYEFRKRRLTDEAGEVVGAAGIGRDISERRRGERRLEQQLDQFESFGSVLSHDLQTPLATARGRLELARETGDEADLEAAERDLDALADRIDDLAAVMREGELAGDRGAVNPGERAAALWETLDTGDATLDAETRDVVADADALDRLLENLLTNALDHAGAGVRVEVGDTDDGFYVADDGPGIPAEERDRVFDAGYSGAEDGTGFGLAIVKQIAVAHGWEVAAAESADGGTRFEIAGVGFP
ncbi:MAG: PAS domain-containing sensor histidine kinase [Halobacteriaceae archaeon]